MTQEETHVIEALKGQAVVIRCIQEGSSAVNLTSPDLINNWELRDPKKLVEAHPGFPKHEPQHNKSYRESVAKAYVTVSIFNAARCVDSVQEPLADLVTVNSKPCRHVLAQQV